MRHFSVSAALDSLVLSSSPPVIVAQVSTLQNMSALRSLDYETRLTQEIQHGSREPLGHTKPKPLPPSSNE